MSTDVFTVEAESSSRFIPDEMKEFDHWVLWSPEFGKQIIAPWVTGHCYPASWGEQESERPETEFEKAKMLADLPTHSVHESYPFPPKDGGDGQPHVPDRIIPTFLLLHDPPEPPIMQVDFDDVRDPETGQISEEVHKIVKRLDAYTEVSQSGEGLHVYVRAALPGGLGKFIADLDDVGAIEMYDHGRVVGATWEHVDGTPDDVPERQGIVEELIETYETEEQRARRERRSERDHDLSEHETSTSGIEAAIRNRQDTSDRSPYFDIDIRSIADTGYFSSYRRDTPNGDWQGPHPEHGSMHSDLNECTNFNVDTHQNSWYCFVHESGGRAIELAAVLADGVDVTCADLPSRAATVGWLRDHPQKLLKTCLWLRDEAGVPDDAKPPYAALMAVADIEDLHVRNKEKGILGEKTAELCRRIYGEMSLDDLE